MGWIVAVLFAVFVVVVLQRHLANSSAEVLAPLPAPEKPKPLPRTPAPELLAADLLLIVERLRHDRTKWDWEAILPQLNPTSNAEIQTRILAIKGPHAFNANAALGTIGLGCKKVLAISPNSSAVAALDRALIDLGIVIN